MNCGGLVTGYYTEEERERGYKKKDFKGAKFDFCDEMLAWAGASAPQRILDVGCGFGGTSRHLGKKFRSASVEGAIRIQGYSMSEDQRRSACKAAR